MLRAETTITTETPLIKRFKFSEKRELLARLKTSQYFHKIIFLVFRPRLAFFVNLMSLSYALRAYWLEFHLPVGKTSRLIYSFRF